MSFEAERYHDFCAGHRVHGHESKCAHLHGHNYRVMFVIEPQPEPEQVLGLTPNGFAIRESGAAGKLDSVGRVLDFSVMKTLLCEWLEQEWDHKFLVWNEDPLAPYLQELDMTGVVRVPFNPTAENMAKYLAEEVGPQMLAGTGARLIRVRIEETRKCSATYKVNP